MTTSEPIQRDLAEHFVTENITYVLEMEGWLLVIENVPAWVSQETGEQFFSPETVERLQKTAWTEKRPARVVETPIYEFAA